MYWADLPSPAGSRPVLVVLRNEAATRLPKVVVAPVSSVIRGIESELELSPREGLPSASVAQCDSLQLVDKRLLDPRPMGMLDASRIDELDAALRVALSIRCPEQ